MTDMTSAIAAFAAVDFNWATTVNSIWSAPAFDVPQLHQSARAHLLRAIVDLKHSPTQDSPLGQVIGGPPGAGKTHLLAAVRQQAIAEGVGFILVDMTDVRNFWETVLQGYVSSLREDSEAGVPQFQLQQVIQYLINLTGRSNVSAQQLAGLPARSVTNGMTAILKALYQIHPQAAIRFQDVVRALILLNSEDFLMSDVGYSWLSGLDIDPDAKRAFKFKHPSPPHLSEVVEGLSWVMSLHSPWVLALDQLDALISQHHHAASAPSDEGSEEQQVSKAIIEGIGGGLMALRDKTRRTLTVVACLRKTWEILSREVVQSFKDRFRVEVVLQPAHGQETVQYLITARVQPCYQKWGVQVPYPTWPFHRQFITDAIAQGKFPRQILQRCDQHRRTCIQQGSITELKSFAPDGSLSERQNQDFTQLDQAFQAAQQQVDLRSATDETQEDTLLGQWLQTAATCLVMENPTPDTVDTAVEVNFPGGRHYPQLHARVRLIYRDQGDREKHLSLRALLRSHHAAYRARLKTAMTTAGIDHALSFRRLLIVRSGEVPSGAATQNLTQRFMAAGGLMAYPRQAELRVLGALHQLREQPQFETWLQQRRPVSRLPSFRETVAWLFETAVLEADALAASGGAAAPAPDALTRPPQATDTSSPPGQHMPASAGHHAPTTSSTVGRAPAAGLPIGQRLTPPHDIVTLPLEALSKHTVILAGSGAGKTVLLRRLVEEAILQNIPAIVIDGANDLARLGDPWPQDPPGWDAGDRQKAAQYHASVDVVVWTPGREAGNPITLTPLPEFIALRRDADELDQAIDMARDSLQEVVAAGKSATARVRRGILRNALDWFARTSPASSLEAFAAFLRELPPEATGNISKAHQHAQAMADLLSAEMADNPLLRQSGAPLNPATLLGMDTASPRTRLSVLNFIGLPGLPQQQQFLNQLAMTLFTWIKKNPAPANQPLRGLLVLDEAKDFLPARQSTPCKSSLNRLAAQARKYGLGLIFATQAPKSIDHNIIANCSTQFYGRSNSPAAIAVVQDQLRQRGGQGNDVAQLKRGQFYVAAEAIHPPLKVATPLCLSHHPPSPLDETEVLQRARRLAQHQRLTQ